MENITIGSKIDNTFEFEATAQGIDVKSGKIMLRVDVTDELCYTIKCKHIAGIKWTATIPKNTFDPGSYDYTLCVIVDDFYFEPVLGKLNVVDKDSITINATDEKKEKVVDKDSVTNSATDEKKKKPSKKKKPKNSIQLKEALTNNYQFFKTDHPYEQLKDGGIMDRKVKLLLKELNIKED